MILAASGWTTAPGASTAHMATLRSSAGRDDSLYALNYPCVARAHLNARLDHMDHISLIMLDWIT